jgi:tetratricopeptide (TPR) repeat protein
MTAKKDLKKIVRARQQKTGESYTTALMHVAQARAEILGLPAEAAPMPSTSPQRADAVVLKVNDLSARIRIPGEDGEVTFKNGDACLLMPGQVATFTLAKRWTHRGHAYASGKLENARIDIAKLGLEPLPLSSSGPVDLRDVYEPFRRPDPYAPLWKRLTARPRASWVMDPLAWGAFPDADLDDNPTCDAAELQELGRYDEARDLLVGALHRDLRCIDAHAGLGNLVFDRLPKGALTHFEIGMRIAELSFPTDFDGVFLWGHIYNRPYLRCLHGFGLCLWRLGRIDEALRVFERILALNPPDNQGVRFCWSDIREGRSWGETMAREDMQRAGDATLH